MATFPPGYLCRLLQAPVKCSFAIKVRGWTRDEPSQDTSPSLPGGLSTAWRLVGDLGGGQASLSLMSCWQPFSWLDVRGGWGGERVQSTLALEPL